MTTPASRSATDSAPTPTTVEGIVAHGRRLGRQLGFPTANVPAPDSLTAPDGVYRARVEVGGRSYDAMTNLGRNPSVGGTERRLESHLFGFDGTLYGLTIRITLTERIREERRFASVAELQAQIARDRAEILRRIEAERNGRKEE